MGSSLWLVDKEETNEKETVRWNIDVRKCQGGGFSSPASHLQNERLWKDKEPIITKSYIEKNFKSCSWIRISPILKDLSWIFAFSCMNKTIGKLFL